MIGYAFCGSFCTVSRSMAVLESLCKKYEVLPVFSECLANTDTRFGRAADICANIEYICQKKAIRTITQAETLGPSVKLDALIISPCTGNTLAKLAHGITDTPVTMAVKAHLRNERPVVLAVSSCP